MFRFLDFRVPFLATVVLLAGTCVYLKTLQAAEMSFAASSVERLPSEKIQCDDWRKPSQYDEAWEQVSFKVACSAHDQCYRTAGATWSTCNLQYQRDLRAACDSAFSTAAAADLTTSSELAPSLAVCYDIADQYFSRVQRPVALRKFQKAQEAEAIAGSIDSNGGLPGEHGSDPEAKSKVLTQGSSMMLVRRTGE